MKGKDPAIVLPGVGSNEWKSYVYTKPCTWMFIVYIKSYIPFFKLE